MSAMLQFEGMLMDHQVHLANRNAQEWADLATELGRRLEESDEAIAVNLGVRYALADQLRRVDPTNPLLIDEPLRNRLIEAAEQAYHLAGKNFDAARQAGLTFDIPGRPTSSADSARLSRLIEKLREKERGLPLLTALDRADFTFLIEVALRDY